MTAQEIIDIYISFFEKRGHKRIPNSPLVPENDPTTLFTSSGMQPLVSFLLGEPHPQGNRLVNVQNCFRAVDIDEVGDNRHTTFFRMLGNWSLGDYFKAEEIPWLWEFLTKALGLPKEKLYITVFEGFENIPKDTTSYELWKKILENENLDPKERISYYGVNQNWWSRSGPPDKMPVGEIGGPDTEVFFDFGTQHNTKFGPKCHPNCQCGRFIEIANSVFIQYQKQGDGIFRELPKRNVDFGAGVERLLAAVENKSDIFQTSLYSEGLKSLKALTKTNLTYETNPKPYRIILDHLTAAIFMVNAGVMPSNKGQGYVLRRLIRRSMIQARELGMEGDEWLSNVSPILEVSHNVDGSLTKDTQEIAYILTQEIDKFRKTIQEGLKIFEGYEDSQLNALNAFNLYQSYGFPFEVSKELFEQKGKILDEEEFNRAVELHKNLSRKASAKMFKGGLADHSEQTIRGHTATHLLHQAIRDLLGGKVHQSGSNITSERVRFDFNFDRNLTQDELEKVEQVVNERIKENLPVKFEIMSLDEAKKIGAIGLFDEKYSDKVKIYSIGKADKPYSVEFCGGPHVNFTKELKSFKIIKQENIGRGLRRLYAVVG